ncbi:MAG: flagellar FliJ family protein [Melioribacteraceae bacterium]|nr:flagellar FliJ family protein [Melioribacteraceae bacterium]
MAKFKYKYESLKRIKEALEKKVQREINVIDIDIRRCENEVVGMNGKKTEQKEKMYAKKNLKNSELQFLNNFMNYMDGQIRQKKEEITRLNRSREHKLLELIEKSKELKVFSVLEEKHLEQFTYEQNKIEQNELDEIASKKITKEGE